MPPKDRGAGSPLGPLGTAKLSGKEVHRYLGAQPATALRWALHTALYPSITCCDFGRPARP